MYSDAVQTLLDEAGAEPGDRITVATGDTDYTGTLMPRSEQGDRDAIVLKLDNGYNIGVRCTDTVSVDVVEKRDLEPDREMDLPDEDTELPDVTILHTGGTIASRVSYEAGGVTAAFDPEDLLEIYPDLFNRANIDTAVVKQMYSGDMEPAHWVQIAEAVSEHRDTDGIIIGHGTDTMHFSAAALSFMLENIDVPVVFVGSQRSSDRPSSDAAFNLFSAVEFIKEDIPGVYVCMHESSDDATAAVHHGTAVRKMHTSRRDTFQSIDRDPVARVDPEAGEVELNDVPDTGNGTEFTLRTELDERVGLLYTQPGIDPDTISAYGDGAYRGLVLAGTGLGHLPVNAFDEHTAHHEDILDSIDEMTDNVVVAMSSQCINGRVNMHIYDYGVKLDAAGVISAESMIPEVAYVKLMWALGQTETLDEAAALFQTNVAGEIIPREEYDAY